MTYFMLKNVVSGLLTGDNVIPKDNNVMRGLVSYALTTVATQANSTHLMTLDAENNNILRIAHGDYYIKVPSSPRNEDDVIDIDKELVFAVARYIASYLSKDKGGVHVNAATRIILDYNAKVAALLESLSLEAIQDACVNE